MVPESRIWTTPTEALRETAPDTPVLYVCPEVLQTTARCFRAAFPGLVTYAVKANPSDTVLSNLTQAGITGFDVASVPEIEACRRIAPGAALHFNNPVRSRAEIARAVALGVRSFSLDSHAELERLRSHLPPGSEATVRFKLPVPGAAYDFGTKFGLPAEAAAPLLRAVADAGLVPSLTFHPGTQCTEAEAWTSYITRAAQIARDAGVTLARLNVGGGFPSHRTNGAPPDIEGLLDTIHRATRNAFGAHPPALVCEPGRAMVAESMVLATRVRALREDGSVFLNDGIYGALAELAVLGNTNRITVVTPDGAPRQGAPAHGLTLFGPTCDSLDRLPGTATLPEDIAEGDYLLFAGMGAYSTVTNTGFNGFGALRTETVQRLTS